MLSNTLQAKLVTCLLELSEPVFSQAQCGMAAAEAPLPGMWEGSWVGVCGEVDSNGRMLDESRSSRSQQQC